MACRGLVVPFPVKIRDPQPRPRGPRPLPRELLLPYGRPTALLQAQFTPLYAPAVGM